jgi:putative nucleotidyltransferase with HDIG domain
VWDLVFVTSGRDALARLAAEPFDVVVSDMRMPGMDGAALLSQVQAEHPATVRIVLSGYTELEVAVRAASVAHLFLAKPCGSRELMATIERACGLRELLADGALLQAVGAASTLPSVPATYARLNEALADSATTSAEAAKIVEQDMAMSAKVLQLVNSGFFRLGRDVTSVSEAVSYLGVPTLKVLALSAGAFDAFEPCEPLAGFSIETLQQHSLLVARIATRLADEAQSPDDVLAAALLHDVGKLVCAAHLPAAFAESLAVAAREPTPLFLVEQRQRQVTHAEIGAYLLGVWGVPDPLVEAVAHHHRPKRVPSATLTPSAIVHVADALAHEVSPIEGEPAPGVDEEYLASIGFDQRLELWRSLAAAEVDAASAGPASLTEPPGGRCRPAAGRSGSRSPAGSGSGHRRPAP